MNSTNVFKHLGRLGVVGAFLVGCTAVVDTDIKAGGVGAQCKVSGDCQAGSCSADGLCISACSADADCPTTTSCFAGSCAKPLKIGTMWVGASAGGEGWTLTHEEGIVNALTTINYGLRQTPGTTPIVLKAENIVSDQQIADTVKAFSDAGADVIVANSFSQRDATLKLAPTYPKIKFLIAQSYKSNGTNADTYAAHGEQSWYVAGQVAGSKLLSLPEGSKHRLGYVGSFVTAESVRHISAFLLGAKNKVPDTTLEVMWMGFWSDTNSGPQFHYKDAAGKDTAYYYEEYLTRLLIDHGAEIIGHGADNQRTVRLVDALSNQAPYGQVYSVSNDNANAYKKLAAQPDGSLLPTGDPVPTCLGSPYWNWGPLYASLFKQMHAGTWNPTESRNDPMTPDPNTSIVGFHLNPTVGIDDTVVKGFLDGSAKAGWQDIYKGPYPTTGQRDKDNDGKPDADQNIEVGDTLQDDEYSRMCWFPQGVVQRLPQTSTNTADEKPALVPDATWDDPTTVTDATLKKILTDKNAEMTKAAGFPAGYNCNVNK